ncbi:MAG TPA: TlyA family RNA methyltransferase [Bdellovibrionales bacterium]|nr:TlyA family RNA methyltransferase [Bdellovibrionales bacterium]
MASSRNRAQELIAAGAAFLVIDGKRQQIKKPSQKIELTPTTEVEIAGPEGLQKYVSRGGIKLEGALKHTKFNAQGISALDVGISTGGFTDCLLQAGAKHVVGIDVGHAQLADKLRSDSRVECIEGINARALRQGTAAAVLKSRKFDLVVIDVSFISLTLVLPEVISYLNDSAPVLALVKPQFEVGRENLGKNGIVKDESLFAIVESKIRRSCQAAGLIVEDYFESSIEGSDGNKEFFVFAKSPELQLPFLGALFGSGDSRGM